MTLLLISLLLLPTPALAQEHYPGYVCDELIVSLVEAVELEIISSDEAKSIILDCRDDATWAE